MEALEVVIKGWLPDAVVCDVMMPRLSGLSVCRELRAQTKTAACPIILLTARNFDEDIQAVMGLGGITYMGKPFEFTHLLRMLWSAVGVEQPEARATGVISGASPS